MNPQQNALAEALEPFAKAADFFDSCEQHPNGCPDNVPAGELIDLTVGDFRRARQALASNNPAAVEGQGEATEAMIFDCDFPSQSARFLMDDGFMVAGGIYEIRRVRAATADDKAKYATRKDPPEYADDAAPNADREGV